MNCLQKPAIEAPNGDCWCVVCEATRLVAPAVKAAVKALTRSEHPVLNDFELACLRDAETQLRKAVICLELAGVNIGAGPHSDSLHSRAEQLLLDIHNEAKR